MEEEILKKLNEQTRLLKSIRRSQQMSSAFGFLKLVVLVVPLILAYIYIPKIIADYSQALNESILEQGKVRLPEGFSINQIQELLK